MKVPDSWPLAHEFACHSSVCAPPPTGTGGSSGGSGYMSADQAAAARKTLGVRSREDVMRKRKSDLLFRKNRDSPARGGSLPGTHGGDHKAAYTAMKNREAAQQRLAQTNRARANYGMPSISG